LTYIVQMNDTDRVSALEAHCLQTSHRLFHHHLSLCLGDGPLRGGGIDENWFVLIICPVVQDEARQVHQDLDQLCSCNFTVIWTLGGSLRCEMRKDLTKGTGGESMGI
ncbi:hypothetical protein KCU73_g13, partial [Aureobasidium melanogenum]